MADVAQTPLVSGGVETEPAGEGLDSIGPTGIFSNLAATIGGTVSSLPSAQVIGATRMMAAKGALDDNAGLDAEAAPEVGILGAFGAWAKSPDIPIAEAQKRVKDSGLDGQVKLPDQPTMRQGALDLMISQARSDAEREDVIRRGPQGFVPSALDVSTSLLVQAVDPLNIAAFSVPVLGEARYGALIKWAGQSIAARIAVRGG